MNAVRSKDGTETARLKVRGPSLYRNRPRNSNSKILILIQSILFKIALSFLGHLSTKNASSHVPQIRS
jgi:hypothetical protein